MATVKAVKERTTPHRERKNPGMREKFEKLRHETNAKRGKQVWVPSSLTGTVEELGLLTDAEVLAIIPAHWERKAA